MYKLLKPTHIGINYMVEKLQDNISRIGHNKIQSLKGENVCYYFEKENERFIFMFLVINIICRNIT
jgi:hypothetical protein